jgi:hypothetical protein
MNGIGPDLDDKVSISSCSMDGEGSNDGESGSDADYLRVPIMLVKLARLQDQEDLRLWRELSWGLVALLKV